MKKIFLILICCLAAACGSEQATETQPSKPSVLIETQLDALDKAKDVEASLQEAVDERDKAMRERGI